MTAERTPSTPMRVWAPAANVVERETDAGLAAMQADDDGWWSAPPLAAETRYRFVLDGEPAADPRSPRQPDGPLGWSQTVDHDAFAWSDAAWNGFPLAAAVMYELHVGTFSEQGTFDGAIDHLDALCELGVNAIEIMPVATFPGRRGWGYDGVNLYAAQESWGGPDGLKRLIDACHQRGLAVVIDVVYNHLGPLGNTLSRFGPYFSEIHASPWGAAVNLDGPGSDEVRQFIVDNAVQWIVDFHADGLRLDAVHALHDESAVHILDQLATAVHAAGRRGARTVWVIAESDLNDPRLVRSNEAYGYGLDAAWSDDFHHALHVALTGERDGYYQDFNGIADLAEALRNVYVFGGRFAPSRERTFGRAVGEMDRSRFVCFVQNHDQVGNRATGERLCHLVSAERAQIAAALLLTSPFVPMLFQGEEWAASTPFQYFTDMDDEPLGAAIRDGRRAEFAAFGWDPDDVPDPQDEATWRRSVLRWDERREPPHASMLAWHQALIRLRREHDSLRDDRAEATTITEDADAGWLVVDRGEFATVVNLGPSSTTAPLAAGEWDIVVGNDDGAWVGDGVVQLGADRVVIVRRRL